MGLRTSTMTQRVRIPFSHTPRLSTSAPRVIRTPDLLIRSQTLYPTELWARGEERLVLAGVSAVNSVRQGTARRATYRVLTDSVANALRAPLPRTSRH